MAVHPMYGMQSIYKRLGRGDLVRKLGLTSEVEFWDKFMKSKGSIWPEEYLIRLDPNSILQEHITRLLDVPVGSGVRILDVGAGPLTSLGKRWPGRQVTIIAVDPLAEQYDRLLAKYQIAPPVRTVLAAAENLLTLFPPNSFDLVHARNSLDHGVNPMSAITQMVSAVKPGHCVFLQHVVNEGKNEDYHGLHQWNFYELNGEAFVSDNHAVYNITQLLKPVAECRCEITADNWINIILTKHLSGKVIA
jgi:SAM-dependent methyltransferase